MLINSVFLLISLTIFIGGVLLLIDLVLRVHHRAAATLHAVVHRLLLAGRLHSHHYFIFGIDARTNSLLLVMVLWHLLFLFRFKRLLIFRIAFLNSLLHRPCTISTALLRLGILCRTLFDLFNYYFSESWWLCAIWNGEHIYIGLTVAL